ncbi:hypothetical protein F5050DRAFT_1808962 [Lentinula boryana]|uniref:Developmental regulatory protein wetA n=1 Tax=Lentinula boryana TaxID=40481 RepID=A0ABQ8Q9C2_9AGAR|nr:hypothetical protein F5050DRAFT_1808962 [Lentinula boryana]
MSHKQPFEFEWPSLITEPSITHGCDIIQLTELWTSELPSSSNTDLSPCPLARYDLDTDMNTALASSPNVAWFPPLLPPDDQVQGVHVRGWCDVHEEIRTVRPVDICTYGEISEPLLADVLSKTSELLNLPAASTSQPVPIPNSVPEDKGSHQDTDDTLLVSISHKSDLNGEPPVLSVQPSRPCAEASRLSLMFTNDSSYQHKRQRMDRTQLSSTFPGWAMTSGKTSTGSTLSNPYPPSCSSSTTSQSNNSTTPCFPYSSSLCSSSVQKHHDALSRNQAHTETRYLSSIVSSSASSHTPSTLPIKRRRNHYENPHSSGYQYSSLNSTTNSSSYMPVPGCTKGLMEFTIDFSYTNNTPEDEVRFMRQYERARHRGRNTKAAMKGRQGMQGIPERGLQRRLSLTSNI